MELKIIAHTENGYQSKFGIPRQSGLVSSVLTRIVFEKEYNDPSALRGIENYSHLWLLWHFNDVPETDHWSPTVRPPRLGGNKRVGVFASRSPFRPNPIGLSVVKLERVEQMQNGVALIVSGADLKDHTPIFDIKPYLPYVDAIPQATNGFAEQTKNYRLEVVWQTKNVLAEDKKHQLADILALDPRPAYQNDEDRVYGMTFDGMEIKFKVKDNTLTVISIE